MPKQLTVRNVPDEVAERIGRLARDRKESLNTTLLGILRESVGVDGRRARLERFATWTADDAASFKAALDAQRVIDAELWR
jgi:hypothetical protein